MCRVYLIWGTLTHHQSKNLDGLHDHNHRDKSLKAVIRGQARISHRASIYKETKKYHIYLLKTEIVVLHETFKKIIFESDYLCIKVTFERRKF